MSKAKKIECILDIFFLIPPILGVITFVINLFGGNFDFARMNNLSTAWISDGDGGMSAAPLYLGVLAMVGAYLIKDNIKYL